jgi:hypothetical protein
MRNLCQTVIFSTTNPDGSRTLLFGCIFRFGILGCPSFLMYIAIALPSKSPVGSAMVATTTIVATMQSWAGLQRSL